MKRLIKANENKPSDSIKSSDDLDQEYVYTAPEGPKDDAEVDSAAERIARLLEHRKLQQVTTEDVIEAFRTLSDRYDDYWGRGLRTPDQEKEFVDKLLASLAKFGITDVVDNTFEKRVTGASEAAPSVASGCSFDFTWEDDYDMQEIKGGKLIMKRIVRANSDGGMQSNIPEDMRKYYRVASDDEIVELLGDCESFVEDLKGYQVTHLGWAVCRDEFTDAFLDANIDVVEIAKDGNRVFLAYTLGPRIYSVDLSDVQSALNNYRHWPRKQVMNEQ